MKHKEMAADNFADARLFKVALAGVNPGWILIC